MAGGMLLGGTAGKVAGDSWKEALHVKGVPCRGRDTLEGLRPVGGPYWSRRKPVKKEGGVARDQYAQWCTQEPLRTCPRPAGLPLTWPAELGQGHGEVLDLMLVLPTVHLSVDLLVYILFFSMPELVIRNLWQWVLN